MAKNTRTKSAQIPSHIFNACEAEAARRRKKTGKIIRWTDILFEAVEKQLHIKHKASIKGSALVTELPYPMTGPFAAPTGVRNSLKAERRRRRMGQSPLWTDALFEAAEKIFGQKPDQQ
jgi:hypothetical protein